MMQDPCCGACESKTGVCLTLHRCYHHKQAQKQLSADDRARETYRNPTADQAIARADRQAINNITRRRRTRGRRR